MQKFLKTAFVSAILTGLATAVVADNIARLVALPKEVFFEQYEERFMVSVSLQKVLLERVAPGMGNILSEDPITDTERKVFECTYDILAERGQLDFLVKQMQTFDFFHTRMESDPEFDFVTLVFDPEILAEIDRQVPTEAVSAMSECGYVTASQERMNITPEFWAIIGQEAKSRGFVD